MKKRDRIILVARICGLVAIAFGLIWALDSFVTIVPWQEEMQQRILLTEGVVFLLFVSLSAIIYGVAKGCKPQVSESKAKRRFALLLVFVLIFAGSTLLSSGHTLYVKAKVRESNQKEILRKHGYYENPYWTLHSLCDFGGLTCFGILGLWIYIAFLHKVAELISRGINAKCHMPCQS
jgi:hypothetical protein